MKKRPGGQSYEQDVSEPEFCLPVPLEDIDTDLAFVAHIGMENLGEEIPLGRHGGEVLTEDQAHSEHAAGKRGSLCGRVNNSSHQVDPASRTQYTKSGKTNLKHSQGHFEPDYVDDMGSITNH